MQILNKQCSPYSNCAQVLLPQCNAEECPTPGIPFLLGCPVQIYNTRMHPHPFEPSDTYLAFLAPDAVHDPADVVELVHELLLEHNPVHILEESDGEIKRRTVCIQIPTVRH